jgi:uncharacterized protein (DUF2344 family)
VSLYLLSKFHYSIFLVIIGCTISSCVNDLDEIEKVTYNEKTPNEVIQDLDVIYLDSGKAKIEVISKITEIERKQESITKLKDKRGNEMTINIEYNQLDPLLRATINSEGDVNDRDTGLSAFPGNINQLLFRLEPYVENITKSSVF